MVIEIKNPVLIPKILELASRIDKFEVDSLKNMLVDAITRDDSKILIEKKDEEVRGFLLSTVEFFNGEEVIFMQACYIEPDAPQAGHEMLNKIRQWGEDLGLKNIYFISRRDPAAFLRKYKFDMVSHVLRRRI